MAKEKNCMGVVSLTNKEKIFKTLKDLSLKNSDYDIKGFTSSEISEMLGIKRNVVSHYLNELHYENKIKKINTRPVYFLYEEDIHNLLEDKIKNRVKVKKEGIDPFSKLIGFNGSLKPQVEQCKVSASYPNHGLPVILTGESGVGKSYIAQLIHEYAVENEYVDKDAPMVIFNCAEYANNPELLSAKLFGYKKGAFTGANSDTAGLIEEANKGYLFLDEVHRLSPEGQEKLFLILDKGVYQRLGESGNVRNVSLRFIFATTEDPEKILLQTFLRRIPLSVKIPSFEERPINERLNFIYKFFKDEACKVSLDIEVSKQVLNIFLSTKLNGNIGKLINIIKYSLAHAYSESVSKGLKNISINLKNLPQDIVLESYNSTIKNYDLGNMIISLKEKNFNNNKMITNGNCIDSLVLELAKLTEESERQNIEISELSKKISIQINKIIDEIVFNKEHCDSQIPGNIMINLVEEGLKILEKSYGIKYYGNTSNVLGKILNHFWQSIYEVSKQDSKLLIRAEKFVKKFYPRYYAIASKLLNLIEANIDYKFDKRVLIYLSYYIFNINKKNDPVINSIIIAHGYSTASSIASVANNLIGDFIFEAFDMPIEVSSVDIANKISDYIENIDTSKGLIILVDMGSLEEIYKPILDKMRGDIVIVNNITTQIALDVGMKIKQGHSIGEITENVDIWNKINCKYIKYDNKKKNIILSTCISGIGTAVKIRDLLNECIDDENIEVIAYDYNRLKNNGLEDKIFREYNVLLIVGTSKLNINEIPYMSIEDLITINEESLLNKVLENNLKNRTVEEVNKDIIKKFSLQNVLNRLTILNPSRIIDQVERTVTDLEIGVGRKFNNNLKISLYVHISCLIERLIVKDYIDTLKDHKIFIKEHKAFIDLINRAFEEIANIYKVEIPIGEIQMIYQIITNI